MGTFYLPDDVTERIRALRAKGQDPERMIREALGLPPARRLNAINNLDGKNPYAKKLRGLEIGQSAFFPFEFNGTGPLGADLEANHSINRGVTRYIKRANMKGEISYNLRGLTFTRTG